MRSLEDLFKVYGESHKHQKNILIHKIFVPLILFSVMGLLFYIPAPHSWKEAGFDWALIASSLTLGYYYLLSKKYFALMFGVFAVFYFLVRLSAGLYGAVYWFGALFILSWIAQFIGHKIEGKKPSFLNDLLFLLVGPLWVVKGLFKSF